MCVFCQQITLIFRQIRKDCKTLKHLQNQKEQEKRQFDEEKNEK